MQQITVHQRRPRLNWTRQHGLSPANTGHHWLSPDGTDYFREVFSLEHVNQGYVPAVRVPGIHRTPSRRLRTGPADLIPAGHARLMGHGGPAAGLRFSVAGNPGRDVKARIWPGPQHAFPGEPVTARQAPRREMRGHSPALSPSGGDGGGGRSKLWANTPLTSGPGAVPTYTGGRAWPSVKPSGRANGQEVKQW
jgi:hypothetical protein